MLFIRLLKALNINATTRLGIISRLGCGGKTHSVDNIRIVSTELLGIYQNVLPKNDQFPTTHHAMGTDSCLPDGYEGDETAMIAARAKTKPRKPSMEVNSVRNAMAMANIPNARDSDSRKVPSNDGPNRQSVYCYRCGQSDHLLKDRPHPFTKQLMFAPARGKGKGKGKGAHGINTTECADEVYSFDTGDNGEVIPPAIECNHVSPPDFHALSPYVSVGDDSWLNGWVEDQSYTFCHFDHSSRCVSGEKEPDQESGRKDQQICRHGVFEPESPNIAMIVGSGASSTVAGGEWFEQWQQLRTDLSNIKHLVPSKKTYRLGDSMGFEPYDTVHINGYTEFEDEKGVEKVAQLTFEIDLAEAGVPLLLSRNHWRDLEPQLILRRITCTSNPTRK